MYNEKLIDYLQSCRQVLELSSKREESEDSKGLTYLYFAPIEEQLSFHVAERQLNHNCSNPFAISLTQKIQNDLLDFRPYFDKGLTRKKIISIATYPNPHVENFSNNLKEEFINEIKIIENTRGILNALLNLRNWAYFPNKKVGSKNRKKFANSYLKVVLSRLSSAFYDDKEIRHLLDWCSKRTRKIFPWGFKKKELLSPAMSALPIYKDEAAAYSKYFLHKTCTSENVLKQHFAEMIVYLSLCFACAKEYGNQFKLKEILQVTKNSLYEISQVISSKPVKDIREKSKGEHDVLQLIISEDFLADSDLWPPALIEQRESNDLNQYCKIVRINGRTVPISQRLAHAIELMGEFSLTNKDVDNRLQEAFKVVGLSQSSGGISPSCFLNRYHHWKGLDVRKHWTKK